MARGCRLVVRDRQFLVPPDMREWLSTDHPVWVLIGMVEGLDTSVFHQRRRTGGVGRAGYDPDMLVTLLIWVWSQGVRSSRRIERGCADVVSYRVICAGDGLDHGTIARFRAQNHAACEQLFAQVLMLAARLGLGRLETVALDGVKIASNASMSANRSTSGVAKAAAAEAARIAKAAAAAHAATDAAEDELYGEGNPGSVPAESTDPVVLAKRIAEALAQHDAEVPGDHADRDDQPSPADTVELQRVAHDRWGRIKQAQAVIDAKVAAETAERDTAARAHLERIAAGEKMIGRVLAGAQVAMAERVLTAAIARSQAKHDSWAARGAVGTRRSGRSPVPVEQNARVRQARARLEQARAAAEAARVKAQAVERTVNITDPQSRIGPLRGGGWLQGYNCQAVTTADGLIVATGVGTSPVDNQYYRDMVDKTVTAAVLIAAHRPPDPSAAVTSVGMVLADAGYCTRENLTAPGPDRLIATGKARDVHHARTEQPAHGTAPEGADPIEAMAHRLRTPQGIAQYAMRSHIAETPFGHAKHNPGFRRFTGRGLARARSEWTFHTAVHNISKILTHLAGAPLPA
jgi:transposase